MPDNTRDTGHTSIPDDLSINNTLQQNNEVEFKILSSKDTKISEVGQINQIYVNETSPLSSLISFVRGVQKDFAVASYPASSLFYYPGKLKPVVTGSASALYELVRGFLYRHDDDPSVSSITSVIQSKTSTSALTGFRMILFDRSLKAETIRPNSFRLSIVPYKTTVQKPTAIFLSNSAITNNSTCGAYTHISGINSLTGSLSTGTVGTTLTGFTVRMKIRPRPGGSNIQTLFHRRVADFSMSALDFSIYVLGQVLDNSVALWKYGQTNSFNTALDTTTINFGTFNYIQYALPEGLGGGTPYLNSFSATFRVANLGGAQIFWSASSNTDGISIDVDPTGAFKPATYQWLSLCAGLTSSILKSTANWPYMFSTPITAYVNSNIFRYTVAYGAGLNILGGNAVAYNQPDILQKARDLPISLPMLIIAL